MGQMFQNQQQIYITDGSLYSYTFIFYTNHKVIIFKVEHSHFLENYYILEVFKF